MVSLLDIKNLRVEIPTRKGTLLALDEVSLCIDAGEVVGVVGESGAGKSLTGLAIIGLLEPPCKVTEGQIWLNGRRLDGLDADAMRRIRGREIEGVAETVEDPGFIRAGMRRFLTRIPRDARFYEVDFDDDRRPRAADIATASNTTVLIRVKKKT